MSNHFVDVPVFINSSMPQKTGSCVVNVNKTWGGGRGGCGHQNPEKAKLLKFYFLKFSDAIHWQNVSRQIPTELHNSLLQQCLPYWPLIRLFQIAWLGWSRGPQGAVCGSTDMRWVVAGKQFQQISHWHQDNSCHGVSKRSLWNNCRQ